MPNWNPIQYEKFLKDRTQPAIDLANRLEGFDSNSILDLGCGPGNSTKVLIDKFPTAKIIGADNSDEMLEKARGLYPDIEFINFDANGDLHEINEKFDMVFSNACIQWLPNHKKLRRYNNLTTEEYYDILSDISNDFEIWKTTYCHRMPSFDSIIEWYKGTGLRPYLEQLTESDVDDFVNDVYVELKKRYKMQKNSEILFRFPRLFFIARKA